MTYNGELLLPSLEVSRPRMPVAGLRLRLSLQWTQSVVFLEHRSTRNMEPYHVSNKFGRYTVDILYDE
jgi:hypothetical protein